MKRKRGFLSKMGRSIQRTGERLDETNRRALDTAGTVTATTGLVVGTVGVVKFIGSLGASGVNEMVVGGSMLGAGVVAKKAAEQPKHSNKFSARTLVEIAEDEGYSTEEAEDMVDKFLELQYREWYKAHGLPLPKTLNEAEKFISESSREAFKNMHSWVSFQKWISTGEVEAVVIEAPEEPNTLGDPNAPKATSKKKAKKKATKAKTQSEESGDESVPAADKSAEAVTA